MRLFLYDIDIYTYNIIIVISVTIMYFYLWNRFPLVGYRFILFQIVGKKVRVKGSGWCPAVLAECLHVCRLKKLDIVVAVSSLRKGICWRDDFSIYQHQAEFYESFREAWMLSFNISSGPVTLSISVGTCAHSGKQYSLSRLEHGFNLLNIRERTMPQAEKDF